MRKSSAIPRIVTADPKYGSQDVTRVVRKVMKDGKLSVAQLAVYKALERVAEVRDDDPVVLLEKAISILSPEVEVKSKRIGGSNMQVPIPVQPRRAKALAVRWLVTFARKRKERGFSERLAQEILDALSERGGAHKKKADILRMAEANRTFASYA